MAILRPCGEGKNQHSSADRMTTRSSKQHPSSPIVQSSKPPLGLVARVIPGLERLLLEELRAGTKLRSARVCNARVFFELTEDSGELACLRRTLVCESLGLVVREARGRFSGPQGLGELRGKLARTVFDHHLPLLARFGLRPPRYFRVQPIVGPTCQFTFVHVLREAVPILARRLGLGPSQGEDALVIQVECSPRELLISLALPLIDAKIGDRTRTPRSLVGALVYLAQPVARAALCDPDCGAGEVLAMYRAVVGRARSIGLTMARQDMHPTQHCGVEKLVCRSQHFGPMAVASPRTWPIANGRLSRVVSALPRMNTPFQLARLIDETARCLAAGGRAVFATKLTDSWRPIVESQPKLSLERSLPVHLDTSTQNIFVLTRAIELHPSRLPMTAGDRARASRSLTAATSPIRRRRGHRGKTKQGPRGGQPDGGA